MDDGWWLMSILIAFILGIWLVSGAVAFDAADGEIISWGEVFVRVDAEQEEADLKLEIDTSEIDKRFDCLDLMIDKIACEQPSRFEDYILEYDLCCEQIKRRRC